MGTALNLVMSDFQRALMSDGVVAHDAEDGYKEINLGTNIEEDSVAVKDINKNLFVITIHLYAVNSRLSDRTLQTTIQGGHDRDCTFNKIEQIRYELY